MPGCAFGPCDRSIENGGPGCDMCDRVSKIRVVRCGGLTHEQKPCGLVDGHEGPCRRSSHGRSERAELKDSKELPDFSAPRAAAVALGRIRRHRVGPHR